MTYGPYKRSAKPGSYHEGMPIALEYKGEEYPALVGMIVATFAAIERELPTVLWRMTGMEPADAILICAQFRAFSGRLDVLDALIKQRDENSHDRIIYSYCKGLFTDANKIRNRYAHALYAYGDKMKMLPYHHDLKGSDQWIEMGIEDFQKDKKRMAVILGELFAILHQKELRPALYDKLLPQDRE